MRALLASMVIAGILAFPASVSAAKKRVRIKRTAAVLYSSVKLSRPTNSAVVRLQNLARVKSVEYALRYKANGIVQGVMGSFAPEGRLTDSRDLYFGTCSKGVCTPHYGISGATLTIKVRLTNGGAYTKRYLFKRV